MPDSNIRSSGYFIARAHATCRHCNRITETLALAVPPNHELMEENQRTWLPAAVPAFIFFISWLPAAVLRRLSTVSDDGLNHCQHCGTQQQDEDLHCEPGVFMPIGEAEAANIELVYVDEAFEATAAGYAPDPEFLAWPPTSSI